MAKIQFQDKQLHEAQPTIPENKKMTWQNVNEIKQSVNALYDMLDVAYPYPIVLADGDDDLETGKILSFRFTLSGEIHQIVFTNSEESDGADIVVRVSINGVNHFGTIADGDNISTLTLATPQAVTAGDKCEIEIIQVGSVDPGKGLTVDFKVKNIN